MQFQALQDARRGHVMTLHASGCQHVKLAPNSDEAQTFAAGSVDEAVEIVGDEFAEPGTTTAADWVTIAPCLRK